MHRKIVLNSLVAEKLLALEVGEQNELESNEQFQLYLQGRREQSMRQWLYYHDFYAKVKLDTSEIKQQYQLSGRTYQIAYFTIKDRNVAAEVRQSLASEGVDFKTVYQRLGGLESLPQREINWSSAEHEAILTALYSEPLQKDQVIGPIEIEKDYYTAIKILGWTDRLAITESDQRKRWRDAEERITTQKAGAAYVSYLQQLMAGKTMHFHPETFATVVQTMGDFYLRSEEEKKASINRQLWGDQEDQPDQAQSMAFLDDIADQPFLTIDGETWTVRDFQRTLLIHPLVFRKTKIAKDEFAAELQKAVADLVQDQFITREAYKRGYDKINLIERNVGMWRDNMLSFYQRNQFLANRGIRISDEKGYMTILRRDLDPYIADLRKKYQDQIQINTAAFEKIKLTAIDLFVIQKNMPFPIVVPSFPVLTTHSLLDYGSKMEMD
ncbi:hypothetical protein JXO59_12300 [candidate division KSB1 bacterium]|nr:hypothetical protein [candidate division KSB1 bacterium]